MRWKVYAYAGCDTCRRALRFLADAGVVHDVIPIRDQPPTRRELEWALDDSGGNVRRLFNTAGQEYRRLGVGQQLAGLTRAEAIDLLAANGHLVRRPLVVAGPTAWVGFDAVKWPARLQAACRPR